MTIKCTGYIVTAPETDYIWGAGQTEADALAAAKDFLSPDPDMYPAESDLIVYRATKALMDSEPCYFWGYVDHPEYGRVACTSEESLAG